MTADPAPATAADLEAALETVRAEAATEEELAELQAELTGPVTAAVIEEALPGVVREIAERMAAGPFTPAAARGPDAVHADYSHHVDEALEELGLD